jgi:hypothetical protein
MDAPATPTTISDKSPIVQGSLALTVPSSPVTLRPLSYAHPGFWHPVGVGHSPQLLAALVEEGMKKSGVCWVRPAAADRAYPCWHVWHEGSAYVLTSPGEQPLPDIDQSETADVMIHSKDTRERLLTWTAQVSWVEPGTDEWDAVTGLLVAGRLNLVDPAGAVSSWAQDGLVVRLTPTGDYTESPDEMGPGSDSATPVETPATTKGPPPRIVHRRQTRRPPLS